MLKKLILLVVIAIGLYIGWQYAPESIKEPIRQAWSRFSPAAKDALEKSKDLKDKVLEAKDSAESYKDLAVRLEAELKIIAANPSPISAGDKEKVNDAIREASAIAEKLKTYEHSNSYWESIKSWALRLLRPSSE